MANGFTLTTTIDRPIEEVFAFLADGENDPKFSPRVQEIRKTTDGPTGVGTVYASTVKDGGVKSRREFEITEFEQPTRIRWTEIKKQMISVPRGGYDLERAGDSQTRVTLFNEFQGKGFGKVIMPLVSRAAQKDAEALGARIKEAVELNSSTAQ